MALDWENIDHWEAGEVALLTLIAFLLALLCLMLICIVIYGKIYHNLKRNEGKPLFSDCGDGPAYNATVRPHSYRAESSDEDDTESQQNNINMANTDMRKSFGRGPLIPNRSGNMHGRYNTATTMTTAQSASTESDSSTQSSDDTQSNTNSNSNSNTNDNSNSNSNDEDDDINNNHNHNIHHAQQQLHSYNYIGAHGHGHGHGHGQHPAMPYIGYGNEMMQPAHNKMMSHQPPPPPGAMHDINMYINNKGVNQTQHRTRPSNSGTITTMTSLTSITATEPRDRNSNKQSIRNYANQHPINDHLSLNENAFTPPPKQQII